MIQELKLINRNTETDAINETPFNGSSDIDFDQTGNFVRCTGEEGLEQNILKAAITSVQPNGYGTDLFSLLGKKNIEFIRGKLMYELLSTYQVLRTAQLNFLNKFPTFDKKNIIARTFGIKTLKKQHTSLSISLQIQSLDNQLKNKNNLTEIGFLVN